MSYNKWLYVYANPTNLTDPSGYYPYPIFGMMNDCQFNAALECFNGDFQKIIEVLMNLSELRYPADQWPWNKEVEQRKANGNKLFPDENITCTWGASCWWQMMQRAYYHQSRVVLNGKAVELLAEDPELRKKHDEIVASMRSDSRYLVEDFPGTFSPNITFGQHGGPGLLGMLVDATHSETWMVRLTQVHAVALATKSGDIFIDWSINEEIEKFDLRPDWNDPNRCAYNVVTSLLGFAWHDAYGGSDQMTVYAEWTTEEPFR